MLETLMLRLTTNVTVSPANSARSSSAAARMSSMTSGRRSANSAVIWVTDKEPPSRARSIASGTRSARIGRSSRRPLPRRGMKLQYRVLITSRTPWAIQPVLARGGVGDLGGLAAVVALVGDEVLEDDLLEMAVLGVHLGQRLERRHALLRGLADADEDAAGERDAQLAGRADGLQPAL